MFVFATYRTLGARIKVPVSLSAVMIDAASCTKQFSFKQSCRVVMGSEDASGRRRELLEDPQCLNMVLQERVARSQ